jgi:PadR family transcriptional regulator PadR
MAASASLGDFEQLVLLALVRLGDEGYGVSIHDEIVRRAGRDVTIATVYKTLERLEDKGLAISTVGEPTAERGGRRKKYFRIQPAGRRALAQALAALRRMTEGLPHELDPTFAEATVGKPAFAADPLPREEP